MKRDISREKLRARILFGWVQGGEMGVQLQRERRGRAGTAWEAVDRQRERAEGQAGGAGSGKPTSWELNVNGKREERS